MVTSRVVTFMALLTVSFALSETTTQAPPSLDIGLESKLLLSLTRKLSVKAKEGISLDLLKMNVLNLQTMASGLLGQIPDQNNSDPALVKYYKGHHHRPNTSGYGQITSWIISINDTKSESHTELRLLLSSHRQHLKFQINLVIKMVRSSVTAVVTFTALMTVSFALSETTTRAPPSLDIGLESKRLLSLTRKLAVEAKEGISLNLLKMNVLNLQTMASGLLGQIPDQISECQTQAVIKMAAARIGSHEVLGLLLAEDPLAVLSRRLALSLAFLEQVAQQLEDELTMSRDVSSYLAALVFGTNTSVLIIQKSDQVVTDTYTQLKTNDVTEEKGVAIGTGFSFGQNGAHWKSTIGSHYFQITPAHPRAARQASFGFSKLPGGYTLDGGYKKEISLRDRSKLTAGFNGQANFDRKFDFQAGQLSGSLGYEKSFGKLSNLRGELTGGAAFQPSLGVTNWNVGLGFVFKF